MNVTMAAPAKTTAVSTTTALVRISFSVTGFHDITDLIGYFSCLYVVLDGCKKLLRITPGQLAVKAQGDDIIIVSQLFGRIGTASVIE